MTKNILIRMFFIFGVMNQKLKSENTRKLILDKTFELFYTKGYRSASIPEIMKITGLSKGAFYHHFKNKNEIGLQVINQIVSQRICETMIEPLEGIGGNVLDALKNIFTERFRGFTEDEKRLGCPANNLMNEIGYSERDFREPLRLLMEGWKNRLAEVLELGKKRNEIRSEIDSVSVAIFLISAFEGIRGIGKVFDDDRLFEEYLIGLRNYIDSLALIGKT